MAKGAKTHRKTPARAPKKPHFRAKTKSAREQFKPRHPKAAKAPNTTRHTKGYGPSAAAKLKWPSKPAHKSGFAPETTSRCAANRLWQSQLLTDAAVRKWLIRTVGEHAIHVIQEFTQDLSDEQIAQKAGIRASDVRVVLNKLHSYGLATYARNRDKNSGWYSYVWHLNNEHLHEMVGKVKREAGETTIVAIVAEDGREKYICNTCGPGSCVDFDKASALLFRCEQCGSNLDFVEKKQLPPMTSPPE